MATTKADPKLAASADSRAHKPGKSYEGLSPQQLVEAYRLMYTSRRVDDREILLKRQQKIFFQISGAGHEAVGVAAGMALKSGLRLVLSLLSRPGALPGPGRDAVRNAAAGRGRGRRSQLRRPPDAVALELPQAERRDRVVADRHADSARRRLRRGGALLHAAVPRPLRRSKATTASSKTSPSTATKCTYVSLGDGTTSEGEFWESLNTASNARLPVIFLVEDNEYAISVPVEVQTPGGNISRLVSGFPNFHFEEIDGTDPVVSYAAFVRAADTAAPGMGRRLFMRT